MIPKKVRLLLDEQERALLRAPDFERHREDYVGRVNGMRTMVSALEAAGLLVSPEHDALVEDRDGLVKAGTDLAVEHLGYADMSVRVLVERITDAALATRQPAPTVSAETIEEAYQRGHEDGFWKGKTTDMIPRQAAAFMAPERAAVATLVAHQIAHHGGLAGWRCACGSRGVAAVELVEHQADMLAAAGLLVTPGTESEKYEKHVRERTGR